jgi:hypothetical protein
MYNFQKLSDTTSVAIIPLKIAFIKGADVGVSSHRYGKLSSTV